MGLSREKVYIANVLKCRPDTPDPNLWKSQAHSTGNADLLAVFAGANQMHSPQSHRSSRDDSCGRSVRKKKHCGITRLRGKFDDFRGIPLMPTYHPSYVLRNPANRIKRQIWEDMLSVMRLLNHPVTSQQENYFTS